MIIKINLGCFGVLILSPGLSSQCYVCLSHRIPQLRGHKVLQESWHWSVWKQCTGHGYPSRHLALLSALHAPRVSGERNLSHLYSCTCAVLYHMKPVSGHLFGFSPCLPRQFLFFFFYGFYRQVVFEQTTLHFSSGAYIKVI